MIDNACIPVSQNSKIQSAMTIPPNRVALQRIEEVYVMEGVTIVDHPLVQHKLTLVRDKSISTKSFRELLKEIGMLLCYEVTRDLPLTEVVIGKPMVQMQSAKIAGKK